MVMCDNILFRNKKLGIIVSSGILKRTCSPELVLFWMDFAAKLREENTSKWSYVGHDSVNCNRSKYDNNNIHKKKKGINVLMYLAYMS